MILAYVLYVFVKFMAAAMIVNGVSACIRGDIPVAVGWMFLALIFNQIEVVHDT